MFEPEAGPIEPEEAPGRLAFFQGPVFQPMFDDIAGVHAYGDSVLAGVTNDVAADGIPDVDADYAATAGYAEETTADELNAGVDLTPATLIEAGDVVDGYDAQSAPYLPPAETPIPQDFQDPPSLPAFPGSGASGFVNSDDRPPGELGE